MGFNFYIYLKSVCDAHFGMAKKNVPFFHAAKISIPFEPAILFRTFFTFLSAFLSVRYGKEDKIPAFSDKGK